MLITNPFFDPTHAQDRAAFSQRVREHIKEVRMLVQSDVENARDTLEKGLLRSS